MNLKIDKNKPLLKIGILAISTLLTAASAVSGTMPMMEKQFSGEGSANVKALLTIPSIGMVIFVLLSSIFIKYLGKRKTVLLGLFLGLIGGTIPFFINNFHVIQVSRFVLGMGNGLYSTSTASLIGDIWSGDEQRTLLGYQSAIQTFGQSLAVFVAGLLLGINWHAAYLVYLLFIPIIILFALGYTQSTENQIQAEQKEILKNAKAEKKTTNVPVLALIAILMSFVYFNAIMPQQTDAPLVIQQLNLNHQEFFSTSLALSGLVGAIFTAFYGKIYKVLKHFTPVFAMVLGIIGYWGIIHSPNMLVFTISMMIISATNIIFPYIYGAVMEEVPATSKDFFLSLAKVFNNGGAFLSPYTMALTASILGVSGPIAIIKIGMWYLVFVGIVFIILAVLRNQLAKRN
ncbi:MFS transporter [Lactobacillus rizhaonensis]|uniref:MFS transporter n=1 Tax=Lactobacillus rizhaonensis TaxID=3082863 RepID=UPI0030C717E1